MSIHSTKPYLIRSIYEWCIDSDFTPFISVTAYPELDMPLEYVKNGEVIFNISAKATHDLIISNTVICFKARFNGISRKLEIPIDAVKGIFAKEVSQGIAFAHEDEKQQNTINPQSNNNPIPNSLTCSNKNTSKSKLRIIK